ncbi:MAG: hypothetical protein ACP5D6_00510 [Kosmotogaceae bacterium]
MEYLTGQVLGVYQFDDNVSELVNESHWEYEVRDVESGTVFTLIDINVAEEQPFANVGDIIVDAPVEHIQDYEDILRLVDNDFEVEKSLRPDDVE